MPVYEFEELILKEKAVLPEYISWQVRKEDQIKPEACAMPERVNLWGYAPANYFAVKASYAKGQDAAVEWKKLIRALHENHMECVMEMYFPENVNQNLILDALRYWVREYHVDGFHLLGENLPVTQIAQDAWLRRTKIFGAGFENAVLWHPCRYPHLYVYNDEYLSGRCSITRTAVWMHLHASSANSISITDLSITFRTITGFPCGISSAMSRNTMKTTGRRTGMEATGI